jgi:Zn-dependent peptidase ImmA (M78 family)
MLDLKLPYFRPRDLEAAAGELLRRYARWKGATPRPPIDIDDIIEGYLKLELAVVDLQKQLGVADVLGAAWFDEGRIAVDQSLEGQEGRFAFTLAHEVGHWMLHRPLYEADKVTRPLFASAADRPGASRLDAPGAAGLEGPGAAGLGGPGAAGLGPRAAESAIVCRSSQRLVAAEWQANQFAARLLMPATHVCVVFRELCGRMRQVWNGLKRALADGEIDSRLRALAAEIIERGRFDNVSNEAMRRRLLDLKLVVDRAELRWV